MTSSDGFFLALRNETDAKKGEKIHILVDFVKLFCVNNHLISKLQKISVFLQNLNAKMHFFKHTMCHFCH